MQIKNCVSHNVVARDLPASVSHNATSELKNRQNSILLEQERGRTKKTKTKLVLGKVLRKELERT